MVRLTCLLRRKAGLTPAEFHAHWRDVHGPLIVGSRSGSHVLRYEQHPRPLDDYAGDDDPGFDGVTVQWFTSMKPKGSSSPSGSRNWRRVPGKRA